LNDPHSSIADEGGAPESQLPRFLAKSGPVGADPTKTKKDGGGKGNWYVCQKGIRKKRKRAAELLRVVFSFSSESFLSS
jgi:hypothetical protein